GDPHPADERGHPSHGEQPVIRWWRELARRPCRSTSTTRSSRSFAPRQGGRGFDGGTVATVGIPFHSEIRSEVRCAARWFSLLNRSHFMQDLKRHERALGVVVAILLVV